MALSVYIDHRKVSIHEETKVNQAKIMTNPLYIINILRQKIL